MEGTSARPAQAADRGGLTSEDLKGLRRWVVVAGVWAVAATAVALIALLDTSDRDARRQAGDAAGRLARTERKLGVRLDALERRLDDLPRSEDVSKLGERLSRAESDASEPAAAARAAEKKLTHLEERVSALEDGAEPGSSTDTGAGAGQP